MCGLSAFISTTSTGHNPKDVMAMTQLIRHRGPDDEGYWVQETSGAQQAYSGPDTDPSIVDTPKPYQPTLQRPSTTNARITLGHRRLSIVDLSPAGHQPMCDPQQRYWIVYNGEVYNHTELRQELAALGIRFVSRTDTEVILQAYLQWGADCLSRFNGMFAFLIYDSRDRKLFGARDRFGIKPLYWMAQPDRGVAFASEIKQFTALPGWQARCEPQIALDYLQWGLSDHRVETLFQNVYQVAPGQAFQLTLDQPLQRVSTTAWYDLGQTRLERVRQSASDELKFRLEHAVNLRLRADVPVGSCLSGGLDSSSIVCLIHQQLAKREVSGTQDVVSSCSEHARFDERPFIEHVLKQTGVRQHLVFPPYQQVLGDLPKLCWTQDQPFGSTSIYAQSHVFATAREHGLTVMLDGQGADEQLAGYHDFFGAWFAELACRFRWVKCWSEIKGCRQLHGYGWPYAIKQMIRHAPLPTWLKRVLRRGGGMRAAIHELLTPVALEQAGASSTVSTQRAWQDASTVRGKSLAQLQSTNLPALLRYEDRNSMAHSIESRVPFLDHHVVEWTVNLPGSQKLQRGVTKAVLREAMQKILPNAILNRHDKMGFVTPESLLFTTSLASEFRQQLDAAINRCPGYFAAEKTHQLFDQVCEGKRPYEASLWRIVNFAAWAERFGVTLP